MTPTGWADRLRVTDLDQLVADLGGARHQADLVQGRTRLTVASNSPAPLRWARLYLEPVIGVAAASGRPALRALVTPHADEVARDLTAVAGRRQPVHMRRTGHAVDLGGGRLAVVVPQGPVVYVVDRAARDVVTLAPGAPDDLRDLARQGRELLLSTALADGYVTVHAAAVARDGAAVLLPGDKGSGKTTVAVELIERWGLDYLANDRVLLGIGPDGRPEVLPYAMSARIGGGTLRHSTALRAHLHAFDHFSAAVLPLAEQFVHEDKLELTPGEITAVLGTQMCGRATLERIVWPRLDVGADTVRRTDQDPIEALERLERTCLVPDPDGSGWLRRLLGGPDRRTTMMDRSLAAAAESAAGCTIAGTGPGIASEIARHLPAPATAAAPPPAPRNGIRS